MSKQTLGSGKRQDRFVLDVRHAFQLTSHALSDGEALSNQDGGGVYTMSGTAALSASLPPADEVAGSTFVFRALSAHAHFVTGSGLSTNADASVLQNGDSLGTSGSLDNVVGSSVILYSDGVHFHRLAGSGSFSVS